MRLFDTGATRDTDEGKKQYEGYLSPLVIRAFGDYMTRHRVQSDGSLRDGANWQKGIPLEAYMDSAWRHFMDWWSIHRGIEGEGTDDLVEALCALLFNLQGYMHEVLKVEMDECGTCDETWGLENCVELCNCAVECEECPPAQSCPPDSDQPSRQQFLENVFSILPDLTVREVADLRVKLETEALTRAIRDLRDVRA